MDEVLFKALEEASEAQMLVLMGEFNLPDVCWKNSMAGHQQSRRFLEGIRDNFLKQELGKPRRVDPQLYLLLTDKAEQVGDVGISNSLGCSHREMLGVRFWRERGRRVAENRPWTSGQQISAPLGNW